MRTQRPGRRSVTATAVAAAWIVCTAVVFAACESGGSPRPPSGKPPAPGPAVRTAADGLAAAGSSRAATSMLMTSGGTRVVVNGRGTFDYRRHVGRLKVRPPGAHAVITQLLAPGALYMKNRGAGVPPGKWVRVDVTALPDGNLVTNGATDPVSAAELLRGARDVTYEGEYAVRAPGADGVRTRHYRGTVDLAAAAGAASSRARPQLTAAARGFSETAVPFDAYIDGQGRLRKVRHRFTFGSGARSQPGRNATGGTAVASTTWFHGFGAPVKVVMPDPDDIYAGKIASP